MNWQQFQAFVWLRWRLRINQLKRGGIANAVILGLVAVAAVLLGAFLLIAFFLVGALALRQTAPEVLLYVWDGLVVALLFCWAAGVLADLQRSEALSLQKFLHLPVSPTGAFLINYFSSLLSFNLIVFLPAMLGLSIGLVVARGPAMLLLLPLLAAFLFMLTAATYQFQGWLASLMANKRRRRTILVLLTGTLILACQVPNLVNILQPWRHVPQTQGDARLADELAELQRLLSSGKITAQKYTERQTRILREHQAQAGERDTQTWREVQQVAGVVNVVVPPGWLPLGAMAAAEGKVRPALLGTLGLTLIGAVSLWRSYRTTVRIYTGDFGAPNKDARPASPPVKPDQASPTMLDRNIPWISEQAAAVALAGYRSLTRAPEAKMMLLTPIVLVLIFGSMVFTHTFNPPEMVRPLMAFGAMLMVLLNLGQLAGNQFGFDRGGFRVFVLCAAPRREILLGKNLALAPLALALAMLVAIILQAIYPMRVDYFLAGLPQLVSMYLVICAVANWLSILSPMHIAPGSLQPAKTSALPVLLHVAFFLLLPFAVAPLLLPLGVQFVLDALGWLRGVPIYLVLSLAEFLAVVYLYRLILTWQGRVLQAREQKILQVVTTKDS